MKIAVNTHVNEEDVYDGDVVLLIYHEVIFAIQSAFV